MQFPALSQARSEIPSSSSLRIHHLGLKTLVSLSSIAGGRQVLGQLRIAARIHLLLTLAAVGMLVCSGIGLWSTREQMLEDRRTQLSYLLDAVLFHAKADMKEVGGPETEAGRRAFFTAIEQARFGKSRSNYFYAFDYDGVGLSHPDPQIQGHNYFGKLYHDGVDVIRNIVETGRRQPEGGYVEYDFPKGVGGKITPKLAHVRDVPELKTVVGVGVYIDDVNEAFLHRLLTEAWFIGLALLAMAGAGYAISRSITGPLGNALGAIKRLAKGHLNFALALKEKDTELGEIDVAIDLLRANAIEKQALQEKVDEQNELLLQQHKKGEELLRQLVEQAPVGMLMLDLNMVHLACSRRWIEFTGYEDGGAGRHHYEVFTNLPEHWKEAHRRALAGETMRADEELYERPDGAKLWVRWEFRPWLASDETIGGITIVAEDVTAKVIAERALRDSELRMRLSHEAANVGACEWRLADNTLRWSDSLCSMLGLPQSEGWAPIVDVWKRLVRPEDFERVTTYLLGAVTLGQEFSVQWRLNLPEGEPPRWFLARGRPMADASGHSERYFGVIIDITEQKLMEQALRESEDRLRFSLDAGEAGTWELALETGEITASEKALTFLNIPPKTSMTFDTFLTLVHPDDRPLHQEALQRELKAEETYPIEWRAQLPDGSIRWLESRGELRSIAGKKVILGLIQDITKKVQQKEELQRVSAVRSEFLANMSHELRTPMHAILGYSEMCAATICEGKPDRLERYLKNITASGKRLLRLLNDLLDLAKMDAGKVDYKFEHADLMQVVEHTLMELDPLIKAKNLQMQVTTANHTDAVFDRTHLIQVLVNLLANAIKFSSAGSRISIELCDDRLASGESGVRCSVVDEGPGISDDELKVVFGSFVQGKKTKTGAGGTGLGLAICDHIIRAHGGRIWAENVKPRGAAFTFVIPRGANEAAQAKSAAPA
jgi:PAS domain S-box-containing protein